MGAAAFDSDAQALYPFERCPSDSCRKGSPHLRNFRSGRALLGILLLSPGAARAVGLLATPTRPRPRRPRGRPPNRARPRRRTRTPRTPTATPGSTSRRSLSIRSSSAAAFVQLARPLVALPQRGRARGRLHRRREAAQVPPRRAAPHGSARPRRRAGSRSLLHAAARMPEDSADHLTQVWTLRPDLTWEDGKPVTAKDYAFTFRMIRNPEVESAIRSSYDAVASIEADRRSCRFQVTWKKRAAPRDRRRSESTSRSCPRTRVPQDAASFNKVDDAPRVRALPRRDFEPVEADRARASRRVPDEAVSDPPVLRRALRLGGRRRATRRDADAPHQRRGAPRRPHGRPVRDPGRRAVVPRAPRGGPHFAMPVVQLPRLEPEGPRRPLAPASRARRRARPPRARRTSCRSRRSPPRRSTASRVR